MQLQDAESYELHMNTLQEILKWSVVHIIDEKKEKVIVHCQYLFHSTLKNSKNCIFVILCAYKPKVSANGWNLQKEEKLQKQIMKSNEKTMFLHKFYFCKWFSKISLMKRNL